jgi:2,3-bisphosphoglycerate-independent phosphoglycerate mutase
LLQEAVADFDELGVEIVPGEAHRFVLLLSGEDLSAQIRDTDPQRLEVPPLDLEAASPEAESTVSRLEGAFEVMRAAIAKELKANSFLLRGFSRPPALPQLPDLYKMHCGAFAGYPLYRGVAGACGMEVLPCGKSFAETLEAARTHWQDFDFFFLHVKQTDQAGEDGNLGAKVEVLEEVDALLPELLELGADALAVTGDHSTPAPRAAHSWHPVPLLLQSRLCYVDDCREFTEEACTHGHLGTFPARELMGLLLANANRLAKFGA